MYIDKLSDGVNPLDNLPPSKVGVGLNEKL